MDRTAKGLYRRTHHLLERKERKFTVTKTVFITGSSSGFGKATVAAFHASGWNVVATMREKSVEDFRAAWDRDSDRMLVLPLDVTDPEAIEATLDAAAAHFGGIDVVVNIAGFGMFHPFETTTGNLANNRGFCRVLGDEPLPQVKSNLLIPFCYAL